MEKKLFQTWCNWAIAGSSGETFAFRRVCQVALLYQGTEEIFLANWDKLIAPLALSQF